MLASPGPLPQAQIKPVCPEEDSIALKQGERALICQMGLTDSQQARQMIHYLDESINLMQIQIKARQDGAYFPFANTLPPAIGEE